MRRSTRIDGSAGGEPLSCGNQSTYNRVANAGNLHRLSPFQMPFGILHNLTGKSSLTFSIEKCHFITGYLICSAPIVPTDLTSFSQEIGSGIFCSFSLLLYRAVWHLWLCFPTLADGDFGHLDFFEFEVTRRYISRCSTAVFSLA